MLELSKEKANASLLDRQLNQFQTSINRVESELSAQIRYLTQVCMWLHICLSIYLSAILSIVQSVDHFINLIMLHICIKHIELEETFDYLREALTSLFLVF